MFDIGTSPAITNLHDVETRQVRAGKDTILRLAGRASAVDAVAELVWNSLDAEARSVVIDVDTADSLGGPSEIVISDDGHGMTYQDSCDHFTIHGDSWKKERRFSATEQRPMHGKHGRGRFLVYAIADRAMWTTTALQDGGVERTEISGSVESPSQFTFDGPERVEGTTGTAVRLSSNQSQKAAKLVDDDAVLKLTARLAHTLLGMPEASVTFRGERLDPSAQIADQQEIDFDTEHLELRGSPRPTLRLVTWATTVGERKMFLCDENGAVLTEHAPRIADPAPFDWSAYLLWQGFTDGLSLADLHVPEIASADLLAAADEALAGHLRDRTEREKARLIEEWKAEGVYPYEGEPGTPTERVEREVFDIVAVASSPALPSKKREKSFSLALLRQAIRSEPESVPDLLHAVLELPDATRLQLERLLQRTDLAAIVSASHTVSHRLDVVYGLRHLLYSDETKRIFREVDQLHPIVANEAWVFGDEWHLSRSESGLTAVVTDFIRRLGNDVEYAPEPVTLPDGRRGRVDLVLHRERYENDRTRHLVVELKRPMKCAMKEYTQVYDYAVAITGDPRVADTPHVWDFWLLATEVDESLRQLRTKPNQEPGLAENHDRFRIWIFTWGQMLDRAERRLEFFRDQLDLASDDEASLRYLREIYEEFIPPDGASS